MKAFLQLCLVSGICCIIAFCKWRQRFSAEYSADEQQHSPTQFIDLSTLTQPTGAARWSIVLSLGNRYRDWETDRKSTRLNSSHLKLSRMPSSA